MYRYVLIALVLLAHVVWSSPAAWAKKLTRASAATRAASPPKAVESRRKAVSGATTRAVRAKRATTRARGTAVMKARAARGKRHAAPIAAARVKFGRRPRPQLKVRDAVATGDAGDVLKLSANAAFVFDPQSGQALFAKNADEVMPIASITKLMTALVVVEAGQEMDEVLTVTEADIDRIKHTSSRLRIGSRLTRANMLHIALMSSENRAASALGRHYPGGLPAFVAAMNAKAKSLGMQHTRYVEPTGLSSENVSTANDLAKLVIAAHSYPVIRNYSTNREYAVSPGGRVLQYRNSNRLIASSSWDILLQKTGYISEAGRCLVMNAVIDGRAIVMVFLDAKGKFARAADAGRVRQWLQSAKM